MSYYKDVYLKSDHWKNLRLERLAFDEGKCVVCGLYSDKNDVHHIHYGNLYNVKVHHLRTLCRKHHEAVHEVIKGKENDPAKCRIRWTKYITKIRHQQRREQQRVKAILHQLKEQKAKIVRLHFREARHRLFQEHVICDTRMMPWNHRMVKWYYRLETYLTDLDWLRASEILAKETLVWPCGEH